MDRKDLENFSDYKGASFGIVKDFSETVLDIGEEFLNDAKPEAIGKGKQKEDTSTETAPPEVKPRPILPQDAIEAGDEMLDEDEESEDEEEESVEDDPTPSLLKDTPEKADKKKKKALEEAITKPIVPDEEENTFQIIANQLVEGGLFSLDEDEEEIDIKDGESLFERFKYEKDKQAHSTIYDFLASKHGEEGIEVFDAIFQRGVPIKEYLNKYVETEDLASLSLDGEENVKNQKYIMTLVFQSQGLEPNDVEAEVEKLDSYGDLEATSKRYHKAVVKRKQEEMKHMELQVKEKEARAAQRTQYHNNAMNQILSQKLKAREFDGIPVTEKVAKDTYLRLTEPAFKMPDGTTGTEFDAYLYNLNHPDNFAEKVKLALLVELMKKDPSFESIKKKGVSEKTDRLFGKLVTQEKKVKHNHPIDTPSKGFADSF
jgi:hypothetical protein